MKDLNKYLCPLINKYIYYLSNFVLICTDVNESIVVVIIVINYALSYLKCCTHVVVEWFALVI
jgi:hypothetical protein